jgi:hypothetical protein
VSHEKRHRSADLRLTPHCWAGYGHRASPTETDPQWSHDGDALIYAAGTKGCVLDSEVRATGATYLDDWNPSADPRRTSSLSCRTRSSTGWLTVFRGNAPLDGQNIDIKISDFEFIPLQ